MRFLAPPSCENETRNEISKLLSIHRESGNQVPWSFVSISATSWDLPGFETYIYDPGLASTPPTPPQCNVPILTPSPPPPCGCGLWLFLWVGNVALVLALPHNDRCGVIRGSQRRGTCWSWREAAKKLITHNKIPKSFSSVCWVAQIVTPLQVEAQDIHRWAHRGKRKEACVDLFNQCQLKHCETCAVYSGRSDIVTAWKGIPNSKRARL